MDMTGFHSMMNLFQDTAPSGELSPVKFETSSMTDSKTRVSSPLRKQTGPENQLGSEIFYTPNLCEGFPPFVGRNEELSPLKSEARLYSPLKVEPDAFPIPRTPLSRHSSSCPQTPSSSSERASPLGGLRSTPKPHSRTPIAPTAMNESSASTALLSLGVLMTFTTLATQKQQLLASLMPWDETVTPAATEATESVDVLVNECFGEIAICLLPLRKHVFESPCRREPLYSQLRMQWHRGGTDEIPVWSCSFMSPPTQCEVLRFLPRDTSSLFDFSYKDEEVEEGISGGVETPSTSSTLVDALPKIEGVTRVTQLHVLSRVRLPASCTQHPFMRYVLPEVIHHVVHLAVSTPGRYGQLTHNSSVERLARLPRLISWLMSRMLVDGFAVETVLSTATLLCGHSIAATVKVGDAFFRGLREGDRHTHATAFGQVLRSIVRAMSMVYVTVISSHENGLLPLTKCNRKLVATQQHDFAGVPYYAHLNTHVVGRRSCSSNSARDTYESPCRYRRYLRIHYYRVSQDLTGTKTWLQQLCRTGEELLSLLKASILLLKELVRAGRGMQCIAKSKICWDTSPISSASLTKGGQSVRRKRSERGKSASIISRKLLDSGESYSGTSDSSQDPTTRHSAQEYGVVDVCIDLVESATSLSDRSWESLTNTNGQWLKELSSCRESYEDACVSLEAFDNVVWPNPPESRKVLGDNEDVQPWSMHPVVVHVHQLREEANVLLCQAAHIESCISRVFREWNEVDKTVQGNVSKLNELPRQSEVNRSSGNSGISHNIIGEQKGDGCSERADASIRDSDSENESNDRTAAYSGFYDSWENRESEGSEEEEFEKGSTSHESSEEDYCYLSEKLSRVTKKGKKRLSVVVPSSCDRDVLDLESQHLDESICPIMYRRERQRHREREPPHRRAQRTMNQPVSQEFFTFIQSMFRR